MNKETRIKQAFVVVLTIFLFTVFLCGCTDTSSSNDGVDLSKFIGTWSGNMETSMFGFKGDRAMGNISDFMNGTRRNMTDSMNSTSANITELEFTVDTLYMTITTENETQTMSNSYTVEGNQIILSFDFSGERPDWMQPPSNGESPPFDDGGRPSFNGERPSRAMSYNYSFNEDESMLCLDDAAFIRQ